MENTSSIELISGRTPLDWSGGVELMTSTSGAASGGELGAFREHEGASRRNPSEIIEMGIRCLREDRGPWMMETALALAQVM